MVGMKVVEWHNQYNNKMENKIKRKFKVTKKMQEEINKARKECGLLEEPIKPKYELEYLYG